MSKGNTFENDLLKYIFNNTAIGGTDWFVSLHTGDPGEGGNQTTSETPYAGYARVAVARTAGGWAVVANGVDNVAAIVFGVCTSGSSTVTHFAVGTLLSGAGVILYSGALSASLAISAGITPQFAIGALDITED